MPISYIEKTTRSSRDEQNFLLRYYARVDVNLKVEILSKHRKIFYIIKQKNDTEVSIEEISYSSLILAIKFTYADLQKLSSKKFDNMDLKEIQDITLLDIQSFKSKRHYKKSKKDKLLQYWGVVKLLRNENISFRDIAVYLKRKYRFEIGYSTVYEVWKKIEKNHQ